MPVFWREFITWAGLRGFNALQHSQCSRSPLLVCVLFISAQLAAQATLPAAGFPCLPTIVDYNPLES